MKRGIYLAMLVVAVASLASAQVYPVRLDEQRAQPQPAAPTPPSLVLADGGLEFPDGSVQTTATQVILIGAVLVPVTGQTLCYDAAGTVIDCATDIGPGQDGDLQMGVKWPNPRFTKNGDGTVTDNLTGLIWLENADCAAATMNWAAALAFANTLFDGSGDHNGGDCGLSDTSAVGAWRLPNVRELHSLVHYGFSDPCIPNTAGTGQLVAGEPFSACSRSTTGRLPPTLVVWILPGGCSWAEATSSTMARPTSCVSGRFAAANDRPAVTSRPSPTGGGAEPGVE